MVNILIIPLCNPLKIGVYDKEFNLVQQIEQEGKTSDILPLIFKNHLSKYKIDALYYTNGPGSYMSIKVSYLFLKSFSIVKDIPFYACSGFKFNGNTPIKALGKKYFFNDKDDNISIDFLDQKNILQEFQLPKKLDGSIFSKECLPSYNLPAVS